MTLCKCLKTVEKDGNVFTAWEKYDKFSACPRYVITIRTAGDCFARREIPTARTTWRKKLSDLTR